MDIVYDSKEDNGETKGRRKKGNVSIAAVSGTVAGIAD